MKGSKSEGLALFLAILPGICGLFGIGHFYAGRVRRGLVLLIGGLVLSGIGSACFIIGSMSGLVVTPSGVFIMHEAPPELFICWGIGFFISLCGLALWIWQIIDAGAVCRQYNRQIEPASTPSE